MNITNVSVNPKYSAYFGIAAAVVTLMSVPSAIYIFAEKISDQGRAITALEEEQERQEDEIVAVQTDYAQARIDIAQCRVDFSVQSVAVADYASRIEDVSLVIKKYLERSKGK